MKKLTISSIQQEFNARKQNFSEWGAQAGFSQMLQGISTALSDLRAAGLDVSLEIFGDASEQAFAMRESGSVIIPISGVLRINNIHRLLAITVKEEGKPCLKLSLSDFDIRYQGVQGATENGKMRNTVRHKSFDFKSDPDALIKFQREIITYCARNAVIADNDIGGAFDTGRHTKKPVLKRPENG